MTKPADVAKTWLRMRLTVQFERNLSYVANTIPVDASANGCMVFHVGNQAVVRANDGVEGDILNSVRRASCRNWQAPAKCRIEQINLPLLADRNAARDQHLQAVVYFGRMSDSATREGKPKDSSAKQRMQPPANAGVTANPEHPTPIQKPPPFDDSVFASNRSRYEGSPTFPCCMIHVCAWSSALASNSRSSRPKC